MANETNALKDVDLIVLADDLDEVSLLIRHIRGGNAYVPIKLKEVLNRLSVQLNKGEVGLLNCASEMRDHLSAVWEMVEALIEEFPTLSSDSDVLKKVADHLSCDAEQIRHCAADSRPGIEGPRRNVLRDWEAGDVPSGQDEPTRAAVGATDTEMWPPDEGWHFEPGRAAFRGVVFSIRGKPQKLLQELAVARRARDRYELGEAISPENELEASTVRGYLSDVRKILRTAFGLSKDQNPIPRIDTEPAAYQLKSDLLRPR